jgi:probable rRNA maturation factor
MITIDLAPPSITHDLSPSAFTRFLNRARLAIGIRGAVDVLLSSDATLRQLNKTFRGKNESTDVLSFPAPTEFAKKHAGDLAISLETAARQAATYGHTLSDEVKILILHGLLHLSGEDHETDNGEMAAREANLRRELHLPVTLIERTTKKHLTTIKDPSITTQKTTAKSTNTNLRKKSSTRPNKKSSSRPKAALSAAAVERSPHFARTTSASSRKSKKRGSK